MAGKTAPSISRRRFLKTAGATALAVSTGPAIIIPGRAQPKTLRILRYKGSNPSSTQRLTKFAEEWGERNNTHVIVDFVKMGDFENHIAAEAAAQQGHDLIIPTWPAAAYEGHVIDHSEIYQECKHRYGEALDLAIKSSYNPKTQRFWSVCASFGSLFVNYRKDLWGAIGMVPDTWEDLWLGGRRIKFFHNHSLGFPFSPGIDSDGTWRALLYSFGASIQDADGNPALKSKEALSALRFGKTLYEETMTEEVLKWDGWYSNNRFMLAGEGSLTLNTNTIIRTGKRKQLPITDNLLLAPLPQGPAGRIGPTNNVVTYFIWKFANNPESAKQFIVDYVGNSSRQAFVDIHFDAYPGFPQSVPDLEHLIANIAREMPSNNYKLLADTTSWTTNIGYPGYFNAAINEIYNAGLIPAMFANAATGKMTPDEALTQADQEVRKIYDKWRAQGKV